MRARAALRSTLIYKIRICCEPYFFKCSLGRDNCLHSPGITDAGYAVYQKITHVVWSTATQVKHLGFLETTWMRFYCLIYTTQFAPMTLPSTGSISVQLRVMHVKASSTVKKRPRQKITPKVVGKTRIKRKHTS